MTTNELLDKYPASQNAEELSVLIEHLKEIHPQGIVEIGIHKGYSLAIWKELFPDATVIGIDNDLHDLDTRATEDCIIIDDNSHLSRTIGSVKYFLAGTPLDFLFIDGDHMEPGVWLDYQRYAPMVRPGGIIAFHDVAVKTSPDVEVYKVWEKIRTIAERQRKYWHEITGKPSGTGIGILYT